MQQQGDCMHCPVEGCLHALPSGRVIALLRACVHCPARVITPPTLLALCKWLICSSVVVGTAHCAYLQLCCTAHGLLLPVSYVVLLMPYLQLSCRAGEERVQWQSDRTTQHAAERLSEQPRRRKVGRRLGDVQLGGTGTSKLIHLGSLGIP